MHSTAEPAQVAPVPAPAPLPAVVQARPAIRISTLPWIAGAYFLILSVSLLILNPGTPLFSISPPWLRGGETAASALILLWLAGVAARRATICWLYVFVALPQLAFGLQIIRQSGYVQGATLVWFALGLLAAAGIRWRRGDVAASLPAVESADGGIRPDLAGFVLAASLLTRGLSYLLQPDQAAALPQPLAGTLPILGALCVAGAVILALAQVLTRLPDSLRWAAHVFAGLALLAAWALFSMGGNVGGWLRGSSLALAGVVTALLPLLSRRAAQLDRRSFYPRLALSFITATSVSLLIAMTVLTTFDLTVPNQAAREIAFSVTLITIAICAVAGLWLASYLARPLGLVVRGVDRIAGGERNVLMVERDSPTEIARLADAVEAMAGSLDVQAAEQAVLAQEKAVQEERQRLARDLHDSASQTLAAIGMAAHSALSNWQSKPQVARDRIELTGALARRAQAEMRALIFELRPDQLEVDGLVKALELQAAALAARQELSIETSFCEEPEVPVAVKEVFYRVAQEALINAAKHAKARRLELTLDCNDNEVALSVKDDGAGFDPDAPYPGHLGLRSMRERAARVGAEFVIESVPGDTCIRLSYPGESQ